MTVSDSDIPEPDRAEGAPHPRHTLRLIGQTAAERLLQHAVQSGRLHHAWLITGPPGIGKATLAWRAARFLLADADGGDGLFGTDRAEVTTLDTDPDTPRNRRISAMSEPSLFLLRRGWDAKAKRLRSVIAVDEVRRLRGFFALSRPDGGRRVVIVDAAEDMNLSAANALLKLLEEPPDNTVFLMVSHAPSRLLPTIRSRCRRLVCGRLVPDEVTQALMALDHDLDPVAAGRLAELSGGSVGAAWRMHRLDGLDLQRAVDGLIDAMPGVDRAALGDLASALAQRGAEDRRELFLQMMADALAGLARLGALQDTAAPRAALAPSPAAGRRWAEAQQAEIARIRRALALNLDPHSLILDMVLRIDRLAADSTTRR